jgi:hypothetical protein
MDEIENYKNIEMDYVEEIISLLDMYYDFVTVGDLKKELNSIEKSKRNIVKDYSTLIWAMRT